MRGSKTAGAYWSTADLPAEEHADLETKINICEGIATALTAYEATGNLSIAVGSCNNLSAVVADVYWGSSITVFADRGNGEAKAEQAARESTSPLVKPVFDPGDKGTDINDMRCLYGMDAVKRCIDSAVVPEIELQVATAFEGPIPLRREPPPPSAYPIDALGGLLGDITRLIRRIVQAPDALCAQSVLAAAALAAQAHANVLIDGRSRPLSLFFCTVGESGEQKPPWTYRARASQATRETVSRCSRRGNYPVGERQAGLGVFPSRNIEKKRAVIYSNEKTTFLN